MVASLRLAGAVAIGAAVAAPLTAQRNAPPPTTFAITNARLVPLSGPVIEKGTIVVRDGLIAAIGASVATPADARVVDGTGLSIYPGFIEAYGSLGYAAPAATANAAAAAGGRGGAVAGRGGAATAPAAAAPTGAPNSNYPRGFQPEMNAVDDLDADASFDAAHAAGFTTAYTTQSSGGFRGTSAIINLRNDAVATMVLRNGVAQNLSFSRGAGGRGGGGGGGYPGSLMGVISQLRQELFDAQHYRDVKAAYAKSPIGMSRPAYDPSLESLQPVLNGTQPVVMVANSQREIERALELAKEFSFKLIIAGGSEAYKIADRLKAENVTVLLSVAFPRRTGGGGGVDADPEPIQTLRERVEQPKAPALFAKTGVKFAFYAGSNWGEYLANVRRAVDNGLITDLALKAMITTPAELFGVADRVGTLEVGKIANLTLMKGDLFDKTATVSSLFVDGRPVAVVPVAAGAQGGGQGGRGGLSGTWTVNLSLDGHDQQVTFTLRSNDGQLSGIMQGALGVGEIIDGDFAEDGSFTFAAPVRIGSHSDDEAATFTGSFVNGVFAGKMLLAGHSTGTFTSRGSN